MTLWNIHDDFRKQTIYKIGTKCSYHIIFLNWSHHFWHFMHLSFWSTNSWLLWRTVTMARTDLTSWEEKFPTVFFAYVLYCKLDEGRASQPKLPSFPHASYFELLTLTAIEDGKQMVTVWRRNRLYIHAHLQWPFTTGCLTFTDLSWYP